MIDALSPEDAIRLGVYAQAVIFGLFVTGAISLVRELRRQKLERAARKVERSSQSLAGMARKMAR